MNKTEQKAFNWLLRQGLSEDEIQFHYNRTPDFTTPLGGFEVKRLYKGKNKNNIYTSRNQIKKIEESGAKILVFSDESDEPIITTITELKQTTHLYGVQPEYISHTFSPFSEGETSFFQSKIQKLMRFAIPKTVYQALELKKGDIVKIKISKKTGNS